MIRKEAVAALVKALNETDETEELEAKSASDAAGKSVMETICALCNEPELGGGTILLGVTKDDGLFPFYSATGVTDPDKICSDIASACATTFNQPVRVNISTELVDEAAVIRVDVPELLNGQKPVYFKSQGLPRGAFRRVGPTDVRCTEADLFAFFQGKDQEAFDFKVPRDAFWEDIDPAALEAYRRSRTAANPAAEELNWSDQDLVFSLGGARRVDGQLRPTTAGILLFGKSASIRRLFPAHRVDYIRVPGTAWMPDPEARLESIDMRGNVMTLISRVIASISDDLPKTFAIGESMTGQRTEVPVIPLRVVREAVVNALMHRSYQLNQPVQVLRYANRLVIKNPGYSLKSQDRFDEPGSFIRNPHIAEILHETRFAETKGSGLRVMREKMAQSGLASPTFVSDREVDEFSATFLFHHFLDQSDWEWLAGFADLKLTQEQMKALIFVREVGAIDNSVYRSLNHVDASAAGKGLRELRRLELLADRGSGARTHYVAGPSMLARTLTDAPTIHDKAHIMDGTIHDIAPSGIALSELPLTLRTRVTNCRLTRRLDPTVARGLIQDLCAWRDLSLNDLAGLLDRTPAYVSQRYLSPMISEGALAYLYPEMPQHPDQKYRASH